jgi:hypothetical protein
MKSCLPAPLEPVPVSGNVVEHPFAVTPTASTESQYLGPFSWIFFSLLATIQQYHTSERHLELVGME